MKDLLIRVVKAEYISDYTLRLTFNDGQVKLFDFQPLSQDGICKKLKDLNYFRAFTLDACTVDWNNEIGFAPEYLYEHGVTQLRHL